MNITIKINTDNAAFDDEFLNIEINRILSQLANSNNDFSFPRRCNIWDINGNVCGYIKVSESN